MSSYQNQNQNRNNNQQQQEEKEPINIQTNIIPFNAQAETLYITSRDLEVIVNRYFRSFLADYHGCIIAPTFDQITRNDYRIQIALYFIEKKNVEGIKVLTRLDTKVQNGASQYDRISAINNRAKSNIFDITEDGKEILGRMSYNEKWNDRMAIQQVDPANKNMVLEKIVDIDLLKIITNIYGEEVDGVKYAYRMNAVKMIGPSNYLIRIEQLNTQNTQILGEKMGFMSMGVSSIPINTK